MVHYLIRGHVRVRVRVRKRKCSVICDGQQLSQSANQPRSPARRAILNPFPFGHGDGRLAHFSPQLLQLGF